MLPTNLSTSLDVPVRCVRSVPQKALSFSARFFFPNPETKQEFGELEILTSRGRQSLSSWYWSATLRRHEERGLHSRNMWLTSTSRAVLQDHLWFDAWSDAGWKQSLHSNREAWSLRRGWSLMVFPHEQMNWKKARSETVKLLYYAAFSRFSLAYITSCCLLTPLETCFSSQVVTKSRIRWGGFHFLYVRLLYLVLNLIFYLETQMLASQRYFAMPSSDLLN